MSVLPGRGEGWIARRTYNMSNPHFLKRPFRTFNPPGRCYLPYSVPANQVLHQAFFRHLQALTRSGTPRTALEVAKAMLAMDSTGACS